MKIFRASRRSANVLTLVMLFLTPLALAEALPDAYTGIWEADDGSVKLEMYRAGSELQAHLLYGNQVVEADNVTFKTDTENPDPALRSRSLKNIVFIWGLHWVDGELTGGSLYDGSSGRTYHCKVSMKGGKMNLRGYIGVSALGQTRVFHRVSS